MPPKIEYVDKNELRRLFNEANYYGRVQTGEFTEDPLYDELPSAKSGQTGDTRSQRVRYLDATGRQVAVVHQFLKADYTLGGSGLPDPQRVLIDDTLYLVPPPKERWRVFGRSTRPKA